MAKRKPPKPFQSASAATNPPSSAPPKGALVLGSLFLAVGCGAALLLVVEHIAGLALPGCGAGAACDQITKSAWGRIPLPGADGGWPVSFFGAAYFVALLAAWIAARGALPRAVQYIARLGLLGSVGFCAIIVVKWLLCPYCLATHAGNFAFGITMELAQRRAGRGRRWLGAPTWLFAAVFVLANFGLGVWDAQARAVAAAKAERARIEAQQEIIKKSSGTGTPSQPVPASTSAPVAKSTANQAQPTTRETPGATAAAPAPAGPTVSQPAEGAGFTGRYRRGPAEAAIRIMLFTDFQCPDCRMIEQQIDQIMRDPQRFPSVSVSMKHFPFSPLCNPAAKMNLHPNACWAARAAEAAGILWGDDGFWKMHDWLFARKGVFEKEAEVVEAIRSFGYEPGDFFKVMSGPETARRIQADCAEANALGLYFTPMIFINGVELKGWSAPNALLRTVEAVAATNPPPRSALYDQPPGALEKYVADWRDEAVRQLPLDEPAWTLGPADAAVQVVLWGDYTEAGTIQADRIIRTFQQGRTDVKYTFRHCPFNSDCNPMLPFRRHPLACWAAQTAEAAGRVAGNDGYWRMHLWLMEHCDGALVAVAAQFKVPPQALRDALFTMSADERAKNAAKLGVDAEAVLTALLQKAEADLRADAAQLGVEYDALQAARERPDVRAAISADIEAGKKLPVLRYGMPPGLHGIPTIFINSKLVPRWQMDTQPVLDVILKDAAEDAGKAAHAAPGGQGV
jgi:protein-disulfide isomerase/uncharacterized membrane protein